MKSNHPMMSGGLIFNYYQKGNFLTQRYSEILFGKVCFECVHVVKVSKIWVSNFSRVSERVRQMGHVLHSSAASGVKLSGIRQSKICLSLKPMIHGSTFVD